MSSKTQNFYDEAVERFSSTAMNERVSRIYTHVVKINPNRVLDIGCGDGLLLSRLRQVGISGQGVELSPKAISLCNQRGILAVHANIDCDDLPFENGSFDLVVCSEVIEHLFDPDHLLMEINRVLALSGHLILTTPNLGWWLNRITLMLGYQPYNTEVSLRYNLGKPRKVFKGVSGHLRLFTLKSLQELVTIYGFSVVTSFGSSEQAIPFSSLKWVDKLIGRRVSLASNVALVCQKKHLR